MRRNAPFLAVLLLLAAACGHEITNLSPSGDNIICFGDSLTSGSGAGSAALTYPARLEQLIGRPVINAGVPGDTTKKALERLDRDVLQHSPQYVLITLGGNDLMGSVPPENAFANLETIVHRIQDKGALVVVGGIDVPLFGRGYGKEYRELAARSGAVLVPDVLEDIMGRPDLMADRIHPNAKGYAIMADHFHKALEPYL